MGKGYNNYMCKKFFHPTNFDNIKRKWMAEQQDEHDRKKEEEKLNQYRREQETLENRVLLGDVKAKLGLAWMYDQPAMLEKEPDPAGTSEKKFEWQRKYVAPRETYLKNSEELLDQPFGIEVRNVRCMRCKKWGHVNTDRVCPMFGQSFTKEPSVKELHDMDSVKKHLKQEGLQLRKTTELTGFNDILHKANDTIRNMNSKEGQLDENDLTAKFLKNLSPKKREKLLKKLEKLSDKEGRKHKHRRH